MSDDPREDPEEELREMLRRFLEDGAEIDPNRLASAAGLPSDPALIAELMAQLQGAIRSSSSSDGAIDWNIASTQAGHIASRTSVVSLAEERAGFEQALRVASLWLAEATSISDLALSPAIMSRSEWVTATMPVWTQFAEPVASNIASSIAEVLREQAPEELAGMLTSAAGIMRSVSQTLFAMQLGQVVGGLSTEVVSGGDIGIPLLVTAEGEQLAALIPQNVAAFQSGLDIPVDEVRLYLSVRELAHARLFRHARWLRLQFLTSIAESTRGTRVDVTRLEELAADFDPANPERLRDAMTNGELIAPRTEEQSAALTRIETTLALIEGWVDVVTAHATTRLPHSEAIAEAVRRRRATGGPSESALATLVGLELRPRRLREAARMWQAVTDAVGAESRDELWSHPDMVPSAADIDDPTLLIARLSGDEPERDDVDQAIADLLEDENGDRPHEE